MNKFLPGFSSALEYSDVFIVPQYTTVSTRKSVDVSSVIENDLNKMRLDVPVISANMDTISESTMCAAMRENGAVGAMHRFMSIEDNVEEFKKVGHPFCFVSVGVNGESKERTKELAKVGAKFFIVDIAHGNSTMMRDMVEWMRSEFNQSIYIMGGNIATPDAMANLVSWGCDGVKVGVGPGSPCLTKNVTGVTIPQFSAVLNCAASKDRYEQAYGRKIHLVADGGVREIGDIAKALGAGVDSVMCGSMFAGTQEAPGAEENGYKRYRGMASNEAFVGRNRAINKQVQNEQLPTPEGKATMVECKGSVGNIVQHIKGGLQSAFSYANSKTLDEFHSNCKFGTRK